MTNISLTQQDCLIKASDNLMKAMIVLKDAKSETDIAKARYNLSVAMEYVNGWLDRE